MFPTRLFPHPVPSFGVPMDAPTSEPGDEPLVCAQWNEAYTPYILGAMVQLWLESTWKGDSAQVDTSLGKMYNLSEIIGTASACPTPPEPPTVHSRTFAFAVSEDDWELVPGGSGTWVSDVGWCSAGWNAGSGQWWTRLDIQYTLPVARAVRSIFMDSVEIDQSGWSGVPYSLNAYSSVFALSPAGLYSSEHWQYTLVPGYTFSAFTVDTSTVGIVDVLSTKVEAHISLRGFTVNPDSFSPPIRVSVPSLTLEWYE